MGIIQRSGKPERQPLKGVVPLLVLLWLLPLVAATTIHGTVYNEELEVEEDVLVKINTTPRQQFLARDGTYLFDVPPGRYQITAEKGLFSSSEDVEIATEGDFVFDLFLLPDFTDEDELLAETEEPFLEEEKSRWQWWHYAIALAVVLYGLGRFFWLRRKHGPLRYFRRKIREESIKPIEQHKEELENGPGYIENALEIIRHHDGRITQKELRKEMMYLSEAKVSLIVTELEHKGTIEKVKKGRGNVLILKS